MGGNMTHMTHKWPGQKYPAKKPRVIVGHVGYWFSMAHMTHTPAGWLAAGLPACLPAGCVGTANNANIVCLLHELTIVSLLHELSMAAVARWPEGWGGRALAEGQR